MFEEFLIPIVALLAGAASATAGVLGNTHRSSPTWKGRLTRLGWAAIAGICVSLLSGMYLAKEKWRADREAAVRAAQRAAIDAQVAAIVRENVEWAVCKGGKDNYHNQRSQIGKSPFEAVWIVQAHNPSVQILIADFGSIRVHQIALEYEKHC
ncbi:MAG TPA: hypothetical protein VLA52_01590 [Thermohalobaculum sp.]|nr:hypothetical protein [Thermohalobaculum sp.]